MLAAGVVALTVRMLVSLTVVLAVIGVAYFVAKRRASGARSPRRARLPKLGAPKPSARRGQSGGIEVVGRVGLTRGAAAVAVRFGDKVVLLAAGDTGPASMVAEMPAAEWDDGHVVREPLEFPVQRRAGVAGLAAADPTARPGFVEALRQATQRRA